MENSKIDSNQCKEDLKNALLCKIIQTYKNTFFKMYGIVHD